MAERFGFYPDFSETKEAIWVHAVSVGEVQAAVPLITLLHKQYSEHPIVVTTTTPTGAQRAQDLFGNKVIHFFLPFDLPGAMKRFLLTVDPMIAIMMETELWPNLFKQCYDQGIPVVVANGRLSQPSCDGYKKVKKLVSQLLAHTTIIAAQTEGDADRFRQLNPNANIVITGSTKFDMRLPASLFEHSQVLRRQLTHHRPVWIAASTHEGEEEIILEAFLEILKEAPTTVLILVPRHPDRSIRVLNLCKKYRLEFARRSKNEPVEDYVSVYVGDTLGELNLLFAISDVAFVGGSLIKHGGQNVLEPAALGVPVIIGPYTFNFAEITRMMLQAGAAVRVNTAKELVEQVLLFLHDANFRHKVGEAGKQLVEQNRGATEKMFELICEVLD